VVLAVSYTLIGQWVAGPDAAESNTPE